MNININFDCLFFFILFFILFLYTSRYIEPFYTSNTIKEHDGLSIFYDKQFKLENEKMYNHDPLLKNTTYYEQKTQIGGGKTGLTGWEKCRLTCQGRCLSFGYTGNSWCFEPVKEKEVREVT